MTLLFPSALLLGSKRFVTMRGGGNKQKGKTKKLRNSVFMGKMSPAAIENRRRCDNSPLFSDPFYSGRAFSRRLCADLFIF